MAHLLELLLVPAWHDLYNNNYFSIKKVTVGYKRNRSYVLHGTPKRVSESLALGQRRTAVVRLMSSDSSRVLVLSEIGKIVQKKIKKLCSNNYHSIIREHSPTALEYFSWRTIILEVMHKAPTLYTIKDKCLMSSNESSDICYVLLHLWY